MAPLFAPGVYVKEVSKLGKSVVAASTSIPAFIGHTQKGTTEPRRIQSLQEYEQVFGGAHPTVEINLSGYVTAPLSGFILPPYALYYAISLFFANGGSSCWIVSIGGYSPDLKINHLAIVANDGKSPAIAKLDSIDEISLLCIPELPLITADDRGKVVVAMLKNCATRGDRFAIMDEYGRPGDDIAKFRQGCGTQNLSYGAVYYPQVHYGLGTPDSAIKFVTPLSPATDGKTVAEALVIAAQDNEAGRIMSGILNQNYQTLRTQVGKLINLYVGASGALAGIYGATDATRGVWKAPAGMSIAGVEKPFILWHTTDDSPLYDESGAGKDINRIRKTETQGAVVWGARTLAGNDLDYRYISVRRLLIFVGQSLKRATSFAVFEPNNANTWTMVKTMTENFLNELWRQGGLVGPKPSDAFQVKVGLGQTMNAEDVLNGILRIEVSLAPVRPAEFVVLSFSQLVQPT
jgi:phage tail sheath protein FI